MAKNITLMGANYPDVPAVDLPQTGGGTVRFFDMDEKSTIKTTTSNLSIGAGGSVRPNIGSTIRDKILLIQAEGYIFIPTGYNGYLYWYCFTIDSSGVLTLRKSITVNNALITYYE
jgi:hypothetical protein